MGATKTFGNSTTGAGKVDTTASSTEYNITARTNTSTTVGTEIGTMGYGTLEIGGEQAWQQD